MRERAELERMDGMEMVDFPEETGIKGRTGRQHWKHRRSRSTSNLVLTGKRTYLRITI